MGKAETLLCSGHALLLQVVEEMWETALVAQPITERQRADLRLAMTHAAQSAAEATHRTARSSSCRPGKWHCAAGASIS